MSTEIETKMTDHILREFWGGDARGVCVQVTAVTPRDRENGYIQLTMREAAILAGHLSRFVQEEAQRRHNLLKKQLRQLQGIERSVFNEIANIDITSYQVQETMVELVDRFCPKCTDREKSK